MIFISVIVWDMSQKILGKQSNLDFKHLRYGGNIVSNVSFIYIKCSY